MFSLRNLVFLCFFVSGATSLIFENIWIRMLSLVFGSTTLAISSVLTSFMGGLAAGSYLFGKKADRIRNPLRLYAFMEGAVGLWALIVPTVITGIYPHLNRWIWANYQPEYFAFSFLRFIFTVALILPPATLMGGTLPLLSRFIVRTEHEYHRVGSKAGWLYALNTFGAIVGAAGSGFVLMPLIGVRWTNLLAASLNLTLIFGLVMLLMERIQRSLEGYRHTLEEMAPLPAGDDAARPAPSGGAAPPLVPGGAVAALVAFGISGFASMNYQVIWSRALSMVIGSSVYAFTIILAAFLIGIAVGSAVIAHWMDRIRRPLGWLAGTQLWIGAAAAATYFIMDRLPYWFASMVTGVGNYASHVGLIQLFMFITAFLATVPATLGMGASFPLTVRVCCGGLERIGKDVGTIYSVNTIGNILGSFSSAFILVPVLSAIGFGYGLQWSFLFSVILNVVAFVLILAFSRLRPLVRWMLAAAVPAALTALVVVTLRSGLNWDPGRMTIGAFRISLAEDILDEESWGEPEIPYYFDGISTTVSIERWGKHLAMKNNGKVEASNGDDMATQIMVSALPMLMHPDTVEGSLEALLVGWGSGVSAQAAITFPLRSLEVIELEKRVVDSSRHFADITGFNFSLPVFPYVARPRLKLIANDGRNYLSSGVKKYDVIVSEPSNPWISGVSNLFTLDHFKIARANLKRGGLLCQWVQLYEMSPVSICSIFKSFAYAFPYVAVLGAEPGSTDTLMLGSNEPIRFDLKRAGEVMEDPAVRKLMADAGVDDPLDLFSGILFGSRSEVLKFCAFAPVNTDDNAFIEFEAPKNLIAYEAYRSFLPTFYDPNWKYGELDALLGSFGDTAVERSENYASLALALAEGRRKRLAGEYVVKARKQADTEMVELAVLVLSYLFSDENEPGLSFGLPVVGPEIDDQTRKQFEAKYDRILKLIDKKDHAQAFKVLLELPEELWTFSDSEFQFLTAYLEMNNDRSEDAAERMEAVIERKDGYAIDHPELYYFLAKAYYRAYDEREAVREMKHFVLLKLAQKLKMKLKG